jgi:CDP-diacylglycerol--glycerol-3-phosphate 3-phosphatidyltransferase
VNLPNTLTLSRFFLTCLFAILAQDRGITGAAAMLAVFSLAALTDWADGYIARKHNIQTTFGKIMDPIADKFLVLTAFFVFAFEGIIPLWMVILVATREMLVTASRIHAVTRAQVIPAERSGKIKTVFQMSTILVIISYRLFASAPATQEGIRNVEIYWQCFIAFLMIVVVALTLVSGYSFFCSLREADK